MPKILRILLKKAFRSPNNDMGEKLLEKNIKAIWDFRGPTAAHTAEHHAKHLAEFASVENMTHQITGYHHYSEMHSTAFMVISESELKMVRNRLKPHRGEIYIDEQSA